MTDTTLDRIQAELGDLRTRLEHLRVQANLGGKEARDKLREVGERLEPGWTKAKERIEEAAKAGGAEARTLGKSLLAGWDEVRRTHRELSEAAERERAKAEKAKRG